MKRSILIAVFVVVALVALGSFIYNPLPPSPAGRKAVAQLINVQTFSLGPAGASSVFAEREDAFFAILSSRHASALFRELFERGTSEAQLYALCGLKLTDRTSFDACASRFLSETSTVATLSGCMGRDATRTEAITAVRSGFVEQHVKFRRTHERGF